MSDLEAIQSVFALLDREVWIVTAAAGERRGGLAASWVFQTSLDPQRPTCAIGVAANHFTAELIAESGAFALHLLGRDRLDLVWRFALGSGRDRDKLAGLEVATGATGALLLGGCIAQLECRVLTQFDTGDRLYFWADVVAGGLKSAVTPLRHARRDGRGECGAAASLAGRHAVGSGNRTTARRAVAGVARRAQPPLGLGCEKSGINARATYRRSPRLRSL